MYKATIARALAALLLVAAMQAVAAEGDESLFKGSLSPKGNYWFTTVETHSAKVLLLHCKSDPGVTIKIGTVLRWGEINWTPDESFFCDIDHSDGHITTATIYRIVINSKGKFDRVDKVFSSPSPWRYDQHWSVVKWNLDKGTATLHCSSLSGDTTDVKRKKVKRDVVVMIDYR
ncbi:MAG: hypothetical protein JWO89_419 [Verrucomicrobiaceae bacterium]|nr:hypothetical protein [Verrucomicrobiaceae bacterium]